MSLIDECRTIWPLGEWEMVNANKCVADNLGLRVNDDTTSPYMVRSDGGPDGWSVGFGATLAEAAESLRLYVRESEGGEIGELRAEVAALRERVEALESASGGCRCPRCEVIGPWALEAGATPGRGRGRCSMGGRDGRRGVPMMSEKFARLSEAVYGVDAEMNRMARQMRDAIESLKRVEWPAVVKTTPLPGKPRRWEVRSLYRDGSTASVVVVCRRGIGGARESARLAPRLMGRAR